MAILIIWWKYLLLLKIFSNVEHGSDKLKIYDIENRGSVFQICKFNDPGVGVVALVCGHIGDIAKMLESPVHTSDLTR